MDIEEIRKKNFELQEQNKTLSETIKTLLSPKVEPQHVKLDDVNSGAVQPSLQDVANGKVIVDFPEKPKPEIKSGEIHMADPDLPNRLEDVASGKLKVVG